MARWLCSFPIIMVSILWSSCGSKELSVSAADAYPPTFKMIRSRILQPKCVTCHSKLVSYSAVMSDMVVPGNAERSPLYTYVAEGEMPKYGSKLSDAEIESIKLWINRGAHFD